MTNAEILIEGSYLYYQGEVNYSQENFKLVQVKEQQQYHIYSEILSRIDTGEFLKIIVRFEMNANYIPIFVRIEKSIGNRYAQEILKFEGQNNELKYSFNDSINTQEFHKSLNAKHYLSSPAFATSTIFTLSKKFDAAGRTPVTFVGTENEWSYAGPPEEKIVYVDFKTRDAAEFKINNATLPASHLQMFQYDSASTLGEAPVEVFVSKHWGIPYQLTHGDHKIKIKNLKKNG